MTGKKGVTFIVFEQVGVYVKILILKCFFGITIYWALHMNHVFMLIAFISVNLCSIVTMALNVFPVNISYYVEVMIKPSE